MLNIVFIASEAAPLAKTGGLADVVGALPQALRQLGVNVHVILPYYRRQIERAGFAPKFTGMSIDMWADGVQRCFPIHEVHHQGLRYLLVEQDDLYDREGLYGPPGGAYEDNLLRFIAFDRVALEVAARLCDRIDIIHCHDWQTGMVPTLLRTQYLHLRSIAAASTVFTIHNLAYQGIFAAEWLHRLGLPTHHFHPEGFEFHGQINCMKAGIMEADAITTVSPSYASEIMTPEYGCQLEGFIANHADRLTGIVNGIDVESWNPATDACIEERFNADRPRGKRACKQALQRECGLDIDPDRPLLTLISRLAEQKGIDLLLANARRWIERGYQLVVLGSGDPHIEHALSALAHAHRSDMHFWRGFNEPLARKIYAGGDIFLMPSRFEPCGLGQLMAMRYGTVPVVRATGGLKDTVIDYGHDRRHATGIHFREPEAEAFDDAVEQAVSLYRKPRIWARLRNNALRRDSSWRASAEAYLAVYKRLTET